MASGKRTASRKRRARRPTRRRRKKRPAPRWAGRGLKRLLDVRLCDLKLSIERSPLAKCVKQIHRELARRDLRFRPYFWLSDDWFTPEGVTGTAIPFYLAHPRLVRLERSQMGEAEGGTRAWCMKLLRHEVGHAIDHAYLLHRRRRWQQLFGISSRPYPRYYQPNPYSKRHVLHLEYWYAQSHPDEDFAETFAVWLGSTRAHWRKRYRGWPAARRKLEYVDELMAEISGTWPSVRTRTRMDSLSRIYKTLRQHYKARRRKYPRAHPDTYDRDLRTLFLALPKGRRRDRERAESFIRRERAALLRVLRPWTGEYRYPLEHVLKDMIGRCRELKLYVRASRPNLKRDLAIVLTKHTMDSLYKSRRWVEL